MTTMLKEPNIQEIDTIKQQREDALYQNMLRAL